MCVLSKYWMLVKIDAAGQRKIQEIQTAQTFFDSVLGELLQKRDVSDEDIQMQLLQLYRDAGGDKGMLAERCLLCFISWQIEQVCSQLEIQFGAVHGFNCNDLLPYVLDDDGRLQPLDSYKPLTREILESFDFKQSRLKTWTHTKVKQHPALNQFLLGCGIYLVSDWAILNDTKPKQLERIFREFYSLSSEEVQIAKRILESYHTVYRAERLQQRSQGIRRKCLPPTTQQLEKIALGLGSREKLEPISHDMLMAQLQNIASQLRNYRIYVRSGSLSTESLDVIINESNSLVEQIASPGVDDSQDSEDEQGEFLQAYRQHFLACLEQALITVTESRVKQLQDKKGEKSQKFLTALQLFHCQMLSMSEIAQHLGLRAQDAVTRLLKLREFRSDVQQLLLVMLQSRVLDMATKYSQPKNLKILEDKISIVLNEQVSQVMEEAEIQSYTAKNNVRSSLLAQRLCQYLDVINK
jgi:hypothetical protein